MNSNDKTGVRYQHLIYADVIEGHVTDGYTSPDILPAEGSARSGPNVLPIDTGGS